MKEQGTDCDRKQRKTTFLDTSQMVYLLVKIFTMLLVVINKWTRIIHVKKGREVGDMKLQL